MQGRCALHNFSDERGICFSWLRLLRSWSGICVYFVLIVSKRRLELSAKRELSNSCHLPVHKEIIPQLSAPFSCSFAREIGIT